MPLQGQLNRFVNRPCNLLLGMALTCALAPGLQAEEPPQSVRLTNGHWPPNMENTPPHYGVVSHIVTLAFAKHDTPVTYGFFPWSRARMLAEKGMWDGSVAWTCRPEMLKHFHFSDAIMAHNYVLFHRTNMDFDWDKVKDLERYRVGLTQDYNYGKEFEEAVAAGTISADVTTSDQANFRKLAAGRIDLFPMEPAVGMGMLKKLNLSDKITFHTTPLQSDYLYLTLSRRVHESERYLKEFNEGLDELRQSGQLEELITTLLPDLPFRYLVVEDGDSRCGAQS
ncbi:extracellular solute-binding protein [Marinobacter lipolyticus SM19]|uniref:Extracellular solute-binding protein n=1 Tax=Marinobacter lipolyticus SM19 TaxID=1318628 RepID=R8AWT0_9GAMM|nr:ABC transporter substrate-binding protein [Marinobacter lipolyticus]EON90777.1 extracellular solute-binding protein [Marinobacter lipolyticus SM19]